jgi:hypothetical protein
MCLLTVLLIVFAIVSVLRVQITLTQADFDAGQAGFVPLFLRDIQLHKSDVAWADIGGVHLLICWSCARISGLTLSQQGCQK